MWQSDFGKITREVKILIEFLGNVDNGPRKRWLNIGDVPDF